MEEDKMELAHNIACEFLVRDEDIEWFDKLERRIFDALKAEHTRTVEEAAKVAEKWYSTEAERIFKSLDDTQTLSICICLRQEIAKAIRNLGKECL